MDRRLAFAWAASLVLHVAILGVPQFHAHAPARPAEKMTARLAPRPVPPPVEAPAVRPEPPPVPPKRAEAPRAPQASAPAPVQPAPEVPPAPPSAAAPSPAPTPSSAPAAPVRAPAEPERLAAPAAPASPSVAASVPAPPSTATSEASTIAQYRLQVIEVAGRYKRYPRIAQDNNWTGTAEVRLSVAADGGVASLVVRRPSPHGVLDQEALSMIRTAHGRVPLPPALKGRTFSIDVPVVFSLKDE